MKKMIDSFWYNLIKQIVRVQYGVEILLKWETGASPVQCRCCEGGEIPNMPLEIQISGRIDREGGEAEDA